MALYVPKPRVDLEHWCTWTSNPYDKIGAVVGHSFRMPRPDENAYTMAANAVLRLILQYDMDPRDVGFFALGTESSTDNSAGAVIVRGMVDTALDALGKDRISINCEVPEIKHACLGGIYAMKQAVRYLSCDGKDRKAIVVSSDIAEYARGSSGEQTQGAGAVAMLLEADPKMFRVDLSRSGNSSNYRGPDFRKPFHRHFMGKGNKLPERVHDFPVFNGKYSTVVYTDATVRSLRDFFDRSGIGGHQRDFFDTEVEAIFFHRPYHWMPVQAMAALYVCAMLADDDPDLAELCISNEIDFEALRTEVNSSPPLFHNQNVADLASTDPCPNLTNAARTVRKTPAFKAILKERMSLGSERMMDLGNLYTASLPAWLAAGFEEAQETGRQLDGRSILAVGYGSGDASEAMILQVVPESWREAADRIGFNRALEQGRNLGQAEYESLHDSGGLQDPDRFDEAGHNFRIERIGRGEEDDYDDIGLEYYSFDKS